MKRGRERKSPSVGRGPAVQDPEWRVGKFVRFVHSPLGVPSHRVERICADGMIELKGMSGQFAAGLFVRGEDPGLPSAKDLDAAAEEKKIADETEIPK